jgi:hypothetical protein
MKRLPLQLIDYNGINCICCFLVGLTAQKISTLFCLPESPGSFSFLPTTVCLQNAHGENVGQLLLYVLKYRGLLEICHDVPLSL